MKHSRAIGVVAAVLFAALWTLPLARAISFLRWALDYFRDGETINASNDLNFSYWLLGCYSVSLLAALLFAWLLSLRPRLWLLFPAALLAFAAGEVIWVHPEAPIHLFPTMTPWRPVIISAVAVAIAALFIYVPRTDHARNAS